MDQDRDGRKSKQKILPNISNRQSSVSKKACLFWQLLSQGIAMDRSIPISRVVDPTDSPSLAKVRPASGRNGDIFLDVVNWMECPPPVNHPSLQGGVYAPGEMM